MSWYGTRLTDQYGKDPAGDWCEVVDDHDNPTVALVLAEIKSKHPQYPPSYPEVDALFTRLRKPAGADAGLTTQERLCDHVIKHYSGRLTPAQLRGPWTYIGRQFDASGLDGKMRHNHGVEITGVVIPADGDAPGYRVMVADLQLEDAA